MAITRYTNVLGYPIPEDAHLATHADLNYMFQLCGNMKTMMADLYTNVLGYPISEDAHPATHADLNYMFHLCGNMKTIMTDLSRDLFSRPPGRSSRGAQVDPYATEDDSDVDCGDPTAQRGRYV
uniref:Uncharacterized protein n=1 Tax=Fagus sylvatica TaxID=28930 RepID=A0A2N9EFT3_FAGSY